MSGVFKGTVGLRIRVSLGIDISGLGEARIRYEKPDGSTNGEWAAVIESTSTGVIYYDTLAALDLDQAGIWKINGIWDPDGDNIFYGATACLTVRELGDHC